MIDSNKTVPPILYRYRPSKKREIATILDDKVWPSRPQDFDDPWDCALSPLKGQLPKDAQEIANKLRVACFATKDNQTRMWSHYADSHKGICIGYKTNGTSLNNWDVHPVVYSGNPIKTPKPDDYNGPEAFNIFRQIVCTKGIDWQDQDEWRYVCWESPDNLLSIDRDDIVSITFGLRCPERVRNRFLNTIGYYGTVTFKEVYMDSNCIYPCVRDCVQQHADKPSRRQIKI